MAKKKRGFNIPTKAGILDHVTDIVISTDMKLQVNAWNKGAERVYGWSEKEALGKKISEILPIKNHSQDRREIIKYVKEHGRWQGEVVQVTKNGEELHGLSTVSYLKDEKGRSIGYVAVVKDITRLKEAKQHLIKKVSQQQAISEFGLAALQSDNLETTFQKAIDALVKSLDIDYAKILKFQPEYQNLLLVKGYGWKKRIKNGKTTIDVGNKSQAGYSLKKDKPVLVKNLENDKRFDGPQLLLSHNVKSGMSVVITLPSGERYGVLGVHSKKIQTFSKNDINFLQSVANILSTSITIDRDKKELQKVQQRLMLAQESGGVGLFEWNLKNNDLWWSETEKKLFGWEDKKVKSHLLRSRMFPKEISLIKEKIRSAKEVNEKVEFDFRIIKNNQIRWLRTVGRVQTNKNGKPELFRGVNYDITSTKKLENALTFRAMTSRILGASLDFEKTLKSLARITVPAIADWCEIDIVSEKGEIEVMEVVHKDRKKTELVRRLREEFPIEYNSPTGVPHVIRTGELEFYPDITDEILKKVSKSKKQYGLLKELEISSVIIVPLKVLYKTIGAISLVTSESKRKFTDIDRDLARELGTNASLAIENARLYSYVESERERLTTLLSSTSGVFWESWVRPDESGHKINYVSDNVKDILGYSKEEWLTTPDFWLSCVHPEDKETADKIATQLFKKGESGVNRFRWIKKGGDIIWVEARSSIVTNKKGKPIGMRGIDLDITDRMEIEERKDEFISLASHELKTPLTSLKVYSHLFAKRALQGGDERLIGSIGKMENQINKLSDLINDLLDLSRIQAGKLMYRKEEVDFDEFASEMIENIKNITYSHKITVSGNVGRKVEIDRNRIGQVIQNFLSNAIKYSPPNTTIKIRKKRENGNLIFSVSDQGKGITKKQQQKIFERFYQVDREDNRTATGLGIGLYICSEIIKKHEGKIWVESKKGEGSTFYFSLPIPHENLTSS